MVGLLTASQYARVWFLAVTHALDYWPNNQMSTENHQHNSKNNNSTNNSNDLISICNNNDPISISNNNECTSTINSKQAGKNKYSTNRNWGRPNDKEEEGWTQVTRGKKSPPWSFIYWLYFPCIRHVGWPLNNPSPDCCGKVQGRWSVDRSASNVRATGVWVCLIWRAAGSLKDLHT